MSGSAIQVKGQVDKDKSTMGDKSPKNKEKRKKKQVEKKEKKKGKEILIGKFPFRPLGKAMAIGEPEGMVKLIFDAKFLDGHDAIGDRGMPEHERL